MPSLVVFTYVCKYSMTQYMCIIFNTTPTTYNFRIAGKSNEQTMDWIKFKLAIRYLSFRIYSKIILPSPSINRPRLQIMALPLCSVINRLRVGSRQIAQKRSPQNQRKAHERNITTPFLCQTSKLALNMVSRIRILMRFDLLQKYPNGVVQLYNIIYLPTKPVF